MPKDQASQNGVKVTVESLATQLGRIDEQLKVLNEEFISLRDWMAAETVANRKEAESIDPSVEPGWKVITDILRNDISAHRERIDAWMHQQNAMRTADFYSCIVPHGQFMNRLLNEQRFEKHETARFSAQKFFAETSEPTRCFIQASTTAFYLMQAIDTNPNVVGSHLIYTNSAIATIPMLFGCSQSRHSLWPFRGHLFDIACGGWLIPGYDTTTWDALRELFHRQQSPLNKIILTPRYIVPGHGAFYEREEGALLANFLADQVEDVVVLGIGDRLIQDRNMLPVDPQVFPALQRHADKLRYVISWPKSTVPELAFQLRSTVRQVYWQDNEGWKVL